MYLDYNLQGDYYYYLYIYIFIIIMLLVCIFSIIILDIIIVKHPRTIIWMGRYIRNKLFLLLLDVPGL